MVEVVKRTLSEIMESARMGEPCTEKELIFSLIAVRSTLIPTMSKLAQFACKEMKPEAIKMLANSQWEFWQKTLHTPLDIYITRDYRPDNPDRYKNKELAEKIFNKALEKKG